MDLSELDELLLEADEDAAPPTTSLFEPAPLVEGDDFAADGLVQAGDRSRDELTELLAVLGDEEPNAFAFEAAARQEPKTPIDSSDAERRKRKAVVARRHRVRKKTERMKLHDQVGSLTERLNEVLNKRQESHFGNAPSDWADQARRQLHLRREAEKVNEKLREMLFLQRCFGMDIRAVLGNSTACSALPEFGLELDMRSLIHSYTHLKRNKLERNRELQAACSKAKLEMAVRIVLRETESISLRTPTFLVQPICSRPNEFGVTTVAAYSVDSLDISTMFDVARDRILSGEYVWPEHHITVAEARLTDSPANNIQYLATKLCYTNDLTGDSIVLEGRSLSYCHIDSACTVLVWDFVDEDDLLPLQPNTHLKCDMVGIILIRREVCDDGVVRAVSRAVCTKLHSGDNIVASKRIVHFSEQKVQSAKLSNSRLFDEIESRVVQSG